ncbi:MAG: SDR family oxidoreductase, partial [Acidobacteria bacterium]|nr:SDR family oxidoreductase [Acidobacteriota bacterium]
MKADEKVWLLTGSTGIAAATARLAAQAGVRVFIVSNDDASCRALAAEVNGDFCVADLTHSEQVAAAVAACLTKHERIDALFNVVGISGRRFGDGPLHECTE